VWDSVANVYRLGVKELYGFRHDAVLLALIAYALTIAVYLPAKSSLVELVDASVAVVDEDRSDLSRRIIAALRRPFVLTPGRLSVEEIDPATDAGRYTFVLDIPPYFQEDVVRRRSTAIEVIVDATAISQNRSGIWYIQNVAVHELTDFAGGQAPGPEVSLVTRIKYNPNLYESRFAAVTELISNITMLAIFLTGAAVIRELEHGTIEHLLVMPLRPVEIMLAKIWATGLVVATAATISLLLVVRWMLDVPIAGSVPLFVVGMVIYLFSVTSLGIFLATLARSMPQFALLGISVYLVMALLSGGTTPLDSMPEWLQKAVLFSPTTHFISFAQAILFRGAGLDVVWRDFAAVFAIGVVLFTLALARFRRMVTEAGS